MLLINTRDWVYLDIWSSVLELKTVDFIFLFFLFLISFFFLIYFLILELKIKS